MKTAEAFQTLSQKDDFKYNRSYNLQRITFKVFEALLSNISYLVILFQVDRPGYNNFSTV